MGYLGRTRSLLAGWIRPWLERAAQNYIAGASIDDACRVAHGLAAQGYPTTLGYWDADGDPPADVLEHYLAALDALAASPLDSYLSIKLPSLGYCPARLEQVLRRAQQAGRRVHLDALGVDSVDRTWSLLDALPPPSDHLRCTLPGRWRRSLDDAAWIAERGWAVRVVKGQFPDPDDPRRDPRRGFLEVIDRLAGRARSVSVATHDPAVAEAALGRLQAAETPCDLEVLYGLSRQGVVDVARRRGVPVRVYVPYGAAYLPYCLREARRSPRLLCRVMVDTVKGSLTPAAHRA